MPLLRRGGVGITQCFIVIYIRERIRSFYVVQLGSDSKLDILRCNLLLKSFWLDTLQIKVVLFSLLEFAIENLELDSINYGFVVKISPTVKCFWILMDSFKPLSKQ